MLFILCRNIKHHLYRRKVNMFLTGTILVQKEGNITYTCSKKVQWDDIYEIKFYIVYKS